MKQILHIKNMVCDRCKSTVLRELKNLGYTVDSVELGQVKIHAISELEMLKLETVLQNHGFELIKDETGGFIEDIKIALIKRIENQDNTNLSSYLTKQVNKSYSAVSKLFSKTEGMTVEKYEINLRIEKVKEYIQLDQLNFSEIAYNLNYNNSSHLAKQFKTVTGMSMSQYRKLQVWDRKELDQIV